jgi:demethylmenaquinone methyltransferase/2-methoxy-6-polyprenyl-1,4-benzoquinol methylase
MNKRSKRSIQISSFRPRRQTGQKREIFFVTQTDEIRLMFDRISSTYDKVNTLVSFNLDTLWRKKVIKSIPFSSAKILDTCTGTGELAFLLAKAGHEVVGVDISLRMLSLAQKKLGNAKNPSFQEGDAEKLPFPNEMFHAVTSAFSIRNLPHLKKSFQEAYRVLCEGGIFVILDLTRPKIWGLHFLHSLYLKSLLPAVGGWISGDKKAYQYLSKSILNFHSPEEIADMLKGCGFSNVEFSLLSGGIATLWKSIKSS